MAQNSEQGVTAKSASTRAVANLCGWITKAFISVRHRAVLPINAIYIFGMLITIALAGLMITWGDGPKGPMGYQGPPGPKGPNRRSRPTGPGIAHSVSSLKLRRDDLHPCNAVRTRCF